MNPLNDIAVPIAPEERAILIAMCKAHDREDSAQRGEPDPWTLDSEEALDGSQWQEERVYAMREALSAFLSSAKEPQTEGWRDIASAPKDGTVVDLVVNGERRVGYAVDQHGRWSRKEGYPAVTRVLLDKPTHWMPLPALPSSGDGHE